MCGRARVLHFDNGIVVCGMSFVVKVSEIEIEMEDRSGNGLKWKIPNRYGKETSIFDGSTSSNWFVNLFIDTGLFVQE